MRLGAMRRVRQTMICSFPRKRESRAKELGPRFRGDERD
jgi:hypothetical protein